MKGVIFNILENFISTNYGEDTLEEIYENAKLSEGVSPFIGPISYPDEDIISILDFLSKKKGLTIKEILYNLGKYALPVMAKKYPIFFENIPSAKDFLKTINDIVYLEVKKLYDDVSPPVIIIEDTKDGKTFLHYKSERKLCDLLIGLIAGVADKYEEKITYQHVQCMKDGADECILEIIF